MSGRSYILCVDDEQAVLNQLSAQLTRRFGASHVVECAESAEEALGLIDQIFADGDEVELVICDQVMPGMKGDRFLEALYGTRPDIMKILLTGQAGLESAVYAINHAGLHRYVEKPWAADDLLLAVQNLLTQFRLQRDLRLQHERLARRGRELQDLHQLGLRLADAEDPAAVLGLAADAARPLASARRVAAVAWVARGPALWAGEPDALPEDARRALEAELAGPGDPAAPRADLPDFLLAVPLEHAGSRLGYLLLGDDLRPSADGRDLLSILAGQTAARLDNLRLEQERLESERLSTVGRMLSSIVHDLRSPMTAIKGYAGMIAESRVDPARAREYAGLIGEQADRLNAMVGEVLEFTRGEPHVLALEPVALDELVRRLARLLEPELAEHRVALRVQLDYPGPLVVDAERFERALTNVALNGIQAMADGGTLTVASRLADGWVEIRVLDTGRGIPPELQPRVFEPFFTHGKPRGVGLGMAITRRIVEEHGGDVSLTSSAGEGTCVTLRLPRPAVADSA
jgi:signal transduction histidine kinase/CheY-like chemotaxis protein